MFLVIKLAPFKIVAVKILTILLLVACSGPDYRAPVSTLEQPPSQRISAHIVAKGETLYSIAWRYNLDVRALARANRLPESYIIYPGQQLTLDVNSVAPTASPPSARSIARAPDPVQRSNNRATAEAQPQTQKVESAELSWLWPVQGKILATFSGATALNKGIDIGAKKGEPVVAAAAGTVVYSGDGLRGYGNLLIIRHNQNYLSAYAHNNKLLVTEGETVKAGQQIAEVGSSGTNTDKLHFEIRRDGQPVDPMRYLPRAN